MLVNTALTLPAMAVIAASAHLTFVLPTLAALNNL